MVKNLVCTHTPTNEELYIQKMRLYKKDHILDRLDKYIHTTYIYSRKIDNRGK